MPAEACGLPLSTLVVVDGGDDRTDRVALDAGAITFVLRGEPRPGLRAPGRLLAGHRARGVVRGDARRRRPERSGRDRGHVAPLVDDEADFVVASRRLGQDTTSDRFRKAGVQVFSYVISVLGGTKLTDTSNGYRALRVLMLEDVAHRLRQAQYQTAELLITAMLRGWRVHRAAHAVAAPCLGELQEGQQLPLRSAVRPCRGVDLVA